MVEAYTPLGGIEDGYEQDRQGIGISEGVTHCRLRAAGRAS